MPHPEQEHALMIEVARLRKERDEALSREARLAAANKALAADVTRCAGIESALAAARRECEDAKASRDEVLRYYELLWRRFAGESDNVASAVGSGAETPSPANIRAALAAPAAGEEGT